MTLKQHSIYKNFISVILIAFCSAGPTTADTHTHDDHQHEFLEFESHVHGEATANIALINSSLTVELKLPAFNVFGFEHEPENTDQQQVVTSRLAYLRESKALIELRPACEIQETKVVSNLEKHHHDSHESDQHYGHSDITATYFYRCLKDNKEIELNFILFNQLPSLNNILVQFVSDNTQKTFTATRERTTISLH